MIVTSDFFYGPLQIAQISEQSVVDTINDYVNKYEPEFMRALFGYELSKELMDPANANVQKYKDIIEGSEYTNWYGVPDKWRGLKEVMPGGKFKSAIANFIYCQYTNDQITVTSGTGEKVVKAENAIAASPRDKIARAWNEMIGWNKELIDFLIFNQATYPEFFLFYNNCDQTYLLSPMNQIF